MSLRVKVELALFVVMVAVVGLGYSVQRYIILPRICPIEEQVVQQEMVRCVEAIDRHVSHVATIAAEWAARPDVRESVAPPDVRAAHPELPDAALGGKGIDLFYVVDAGRSVVCGKSVEPRSRNEIEITEFAGAQWPESHPLLKGKGRSAAQQGLLITSAGPCLVASRPIVAQDGNPAGTLVAGSLLDAELLGRMSRQAGLVFQAWAAGEPSLPGDVVDILSDLKGGARFKTRAVAQDMVRSYAVYADISGRPSLVLRADIHQDLLIRAVSTMQIGLLAQVGLGLSALVVLLILFRHVVTNPIAYLTQHATAIGKTNDLSARLALDRTDDIGVLAHEFDSMVGQLEEDRAIQKRTEAALRESEERYMLAVRGANDGLWDWDLVSNTIHFSLRWKTMLGFGENEIGENVKEWLDRVHPDDKDHVAATLDAHLKGKTAHFESEHRVRHKDSSYLWVLCRGLAVRNGGGKPTRMAGSLTDITARKLIEEQLSHQALHDSLTALPNRALFLDRLGQALRHAQRHKDYMFAVLFLDLDRFKVVNDGLGHMVGDQLLTSLADRLGSMVRAGDTVGRNEGTIARFGGDEFVFLLDNISSVSDATLVAQRILDSLREPFQIGEHEVFTSASIGIAFSTAGHKTPEELLRSADTAMYRAKARGKACYEVYDTDMHSRAVARLQIENDLRRAIEHQEFLVYYQPIVSLTSGKTEAFEALVRWRHPERGLVSPFEFVPIAEETGMIVEIGGWVLREACRQTRIWQRKLAAAHELRISVNLSVKEFGKPDLLESIERALDDAGLDAGSLKLEVTESAILENVDYVTNMLQKLRALDIHLSIDDFGTGYSSLSYLHRLPMNTLKIDRAFVRDMHTAKESMQIVRTIVLLAHALSMDVIAEGVETEEQLQALRVLGCEYGQGYLFAKPMDMESTTAYLAEDRTWTFDRSMERVEV